MSTVREYAGGNNYDSYGSNNAGYTNDFLSGLSVNSNNNSGSYDLSDYAMIKNGSYGKLLKAYYGQEKAQKASGSKEGSSKLTLMAGNAGGMANAAKALMDDSLWKKKTIEEKDEKTGEITKKEDYDWNAITKAVKGFIENYNSTVSSAGESDTRSVLRNAAWMVKTTEAHKNILGKVGITITSGNKLELNEEDLKNADISTLKTLFTGFNSYADKMMTKGNTIATAAANAGGTYTSNGSYSDTLSKLVSSKIDTKE